MSSNLQIFVDVTNFCDRGCLHCQANAGVKKARHMSADTVHSLAKKMRESNYKEIHMFVAGGEPLLNPTLVNFFDVIYSQAGNQLKRIVLETSGLSSMEGMEAERLLKVANGPWAKSLEICVSFHSFQRNFGVYLQNHLEFILSREILARKIAIRLVLSAETLHLTHKKLKKVLAALRKKGIFIWPFLVCPWDVNEIILYSLDRKEAVSIEDIEDVVEAVMLLDCLYIGGSLDSRAREILVISNSINTWRGRAKNLKDHSHLFGFRGCQALRRNFAESDFDYVAVSASGLYYLQECLPANPPFAIGHLEDIPLRESASLAKEVSGAILKSIMADSRCFYPERELCHICTQHAARMGLQVL